MRPAALRGWIQLAVRDGVQYLLHHGVGCQVPIGPQSDLAVLHWGPAGDAFVVGKDCVAKPVDELVPKRLFETATGAGLPLPA